MKSFEKITREELLGNMDMYLNLAEEGLLYAQIDVDKLQEDMLHKAFRISMRCKDLLQKGKSQLDVFLYYQRIWDADREGFERKMKSSSWRRFVCFHLGVMMTMDIFRDNVPQMAEAVRLTSQKPKSIMNRIYEGKKNFVGGK